MIINNNIITASSELGSVLDREVQEAFEFAKKYKCNVNFTFNGKTHIINRFTDVEHIVQDWFC